MYVARIDNEIKEFGECSISRYILKEYDQLKHGENPNLYYSIFDVTTTVSSPAP